MKLAQHDTCCEFNFTEWLQASSQVQAANKESKQAGQEQEVFTAGRMKIPLVSATAVAESTALMSFIATPQCWLEGKSKSDWLNKSICSGGYHFLFFSRYLRGVSTGQPSISLLPFLRSFLKRLLSKPRLFSLYNQLTAACRHPQFWEEIWLHTEGNQGVRLWQWHLHCLPHGLGKDY